MELEARKAIKEAARERVRKINFGDCVTNVCAGEFGRHLFFVEHKGATVRCTNKKGWFADIGIEVIYPGHLAEDKCKELFEPVWQAECGELP
jgi:hypothetical protein